MDEAELVNSLDGEDAFGHVKLGHVFGEGVVLDEPADRRMRHREGRRKGHANEQRDGGESPVRNQTARRKGETYQSG